MIGAFDVHFEVVRNPMLSQKVPKADRRDRDLPVPMPTPGCTGSPATATLRMTNRPSRMASGKRAATCPQNASLASTATTLKPHSR
jgi:hypothetical protein